jgi:hypothetical protein
MYTLNIANGYQEPQADHSPPSEAEVKNDGAISPPSYKSSRRRAKLRVLELRGKFNFLSSMLVLPLTCNWDILLSLPLGVVSLDPHAVRLAFQSPATRKCGPSWSRKSSYSWQEIVCLGGLQTAAIVIGRIMDSNFIIVVWILFVI